MADNDAGSIPTTIVFTLIVSFFAFFASVTCVTLYYYSKRDPRRLERLRQLEQAAQDMETMTMETWVETPTIWEVWADGRPKPTSKWEDFLVRSPTSRSPRSLWFLYHKQPLNLTYESNQPQSPAVPTPQSRGAGWGPLAKTTEDRAQLPGSSDSPRHDLVPADCNVSVFIAMPSPYKHLPPEVRGEFTIGTAEVMYRQAEPPHQ